MKLFLALLVVSGTALADDGSILRCREIGDGVICINLTTTEVVEKVVFGEGGLAEGLTPGAMIIDFGTTGGEAGGARTYYFDDVTVLP